MADEQNKMITKACKVKSNRNDHLASFMIPSFPDLPMVKFSSKQPNQGPHKHIMMKGGADKKFQEMVGKIVKALAQGQHVLSSEAATTIVTGVAKQEHEQTLAVLKQARESAQTKDQARRRARELVYDSE